MSYAASSSSFSLYDDSYSAFSLFVPAQHQHPRETHETYEQLFQLFRPSTNTIQKQESFISVAWKKFWKAL
ncbi:hypothetical protein E1B28_004235 [Marasmius oreades]|uniref:Uncharacterized protein n=1 Tax=Marasmius oreades TaxID=181124 RepID=A0A9P7UY86_9AGAR|nr:uncharacterized protein E1B28_004235 [Marasmius oreades]KAG7096826.1 hypothetical protein E1B28_004235 [Marasmius oreades]